MTASNPITLCIALSVMTAIGCSTVPSATKLTQGIDVQKQTSAPSKMLAKDDPVCKQFYANIYKAASDAVKAKRNNADMARVGASVAGGFLGIPAGGMIASQTAQRIISSNTTNISTQAFDPEYKFDRRIIDTAKDLNCPIKIKDKTP